MGINPSADLIWGVVVKSEDEPVLVAEDGSRTLLYEHGEGWIDLPSDLLELVDVGHYEDPDPQAILTVKDSKRYSADAWDYKAIDPILHLRWEPPEKVVKKAAAEAATLGLPDLAEGKWWLIAGLG
jgi:hypothetical protein